MNRNTHKKNQNDNNHNDDYDLSIIVSPCNVTSEQ